MAFSTDGTRIYSRAGKKKLVWSSKTGKVIENANWVDIEEGQNVTPDGRWLVTSSEKNVLVVDLEYKNTPREKAYREAKARPKPFWHREQASKAERGKNWFAATFHYSWLIKNDPENAKLKKALRLSHKKLEDQFSAEKRNLDGHLPPIVKDALNLAGVKN